MQKAGLIFKRGCLSHSKPRSPSVVSRVPRGCVLWQLEPRNPHHPPSFLFFYTFSPLSSEEGGMSGFCCFSPIASFCYPCAKLGGPLDSWNQRHPPETLLRLHVLILSQNQRWDLCAIKRMKLPWKKKK